MDKIHIDKCCNTVSMGFIHISMDSITVCIHSKQCALILEHNRQHQTDFLDRHLSHVCLPGEPTKTDVEDTTGGVD